MRGVRAIVTERGAGCDGRLLRQRGASRAGENAAAYGEVVWSWRRDPGVYPRRPVVAWQRWQQRPFTGESTKEAVKPLRGESRDVSAVPVKPVCILPLPIAHGDAGAVGARLSLRPLQGGGQRRCKAQARIAP